MHTVSHDKGDMIGLEDSERLGIRVWKKGKKGLGFEKQHPIMDFTTEKKELENNNNNNLENAHQKLDSSSQLALTLDSSNKETEQQQSHELKDGFHPLKVFLPHFNFFVSYS
ncbi:hypothetical protein V8G54_013287 [Vigna mungo]|uniref:Uncharacterized protein n=1 Tax=Vigna mungo TaxID=3915 RepID=A0AAQ3S4P8_VIGMU